MLEVPNNGRTLRRGDPLRDAILAEQREHKRRGERYPVLLVDDFYAYPFAWLGRVPYRADTLERLVLTQEARKRPVPLPDHFLVDGEKRLPTENSGQYAKYLAYRDLGPARSLNKVAKIMGRKAYARGAANSGYYSALASRFRWAERVAAWDAKLEIEARRTQQAVLQDQMQEEVKRRHTYLENEWKMVEKGFEILHEMLRYPVVEKKSERTAPDGKTIVTVWQPGKWTYAAMAQLMEAMTKIGRLHTGLSISNTLVKTDLAGDTNQQKPIMPTEDDEMLRFANQRAEEAFFEAIEEYRAVRSGRGIARIET